MKNLRLCKKQEKKWDVANHRQGAVNRAEGDGQLYEADEASPNENPRNGVEVKGWRNGLLLFVPPSGTWDTVIEQVHARLDEAKARSFWRGAQVTLDCGNRRISFDELSVLVDRIKRGFGLVPVAVVATDARTRAAGEKLALTAYAILPVVKKTSTNALPHLLSRPATVPEALADVPAEPAAVVPAASVNNALYVPSTVRSGQRIVHDGHLIVCGDVNAGAEVMAGGDILIFGTLRGLAHAGYYGNEAARIVASSLRPPQLRIAGKIARSGDENAKNGNSGRGAEVARVENGEIGVFPL